MEAPLHQFHHFSFMVERVSVIAFNVAIVAGHQAIALDVQSAFTSAVNVFYGSSQMYPDDARHPVGLQHFDRTSDPYELFTIDASSALLPPQGAKSVEVDAGGRATTGHIRPG